jgi:predicted RNA-binding Zn-ribbon protein involved in translation (DUF1610 family)
MPKACEHNIPETLKGAGECRIVAEVKKRSGKPNWWCITHGMEASAPDGAPLESCPGSWFDPVPSDRQLDLYFDEAEISVWGALIPAIQIGEAHPERGNVHVHRRHRGDSSKDIDASYEIVRVHHGDKTVIVESMAAVAYSISELAGQQVKAMTCPKSSCGAVHIDEMKFATHPHRKHQCNRCGRNFWDKEAPSISNPLADASWYLGVPVPTRGEEVNRPLRLDRSDYSSIALWPSNSAIITNSPRPEEIGVHVHAWDHAGNQVIDETYSPVYLDGQPIDEPMLRALAVQRALAHTTPIVNLACVNCGAAILSPSSGWVEPTTTHVCQACGTTSKTRHRVFLNPLAEK